MAGTKIHKLKKDKVQVFLDWANRLSTDLSEEASIAIKEENVLHEYFGLFELNGDHYLVSNMEGENIVPPTDRWVNIEHKKIMKECVESVIPLSTIINLFPSKE